MSDFPRRMRDWLFNVMRDLAEREELPAKYKDMQFEAETNLTRRWANAAVWKFCDLDASHDRSVSIHELFPIRAPLMSLEHCIEPFLKSCDPNDDHRITLKEWGSCLQLEEVGNRLQFFRGLSFIVICALTISGRYAGPVRWYYRSRRPKWNRSRLNRPIHPRREARVIYDGFHRFCSNSIDSLSVKL